MGWWVMAIDWMNPSDDIAEAKLAESSDSREM